jgi:hypothetical protein
MSSEKNKATEQRRMAARPIQRDDLMSTPLPRLAKDVEVVALEIDENYDLGGDPYNHTGSHCVVKLRDD